ncbi:MAG TPA: SagB/ThcOx family dehydrogenase [Vicinamibacterales bacterium]|nr:SagB/ThcOx family dehydrogenase [Vicinamibacterales bacterium]
MPRASDYHHQTKHSFHRFARSAGYLDWAAQPNPFRRYDGAPVLDLPREPLRADVPYEALFDRSAPPAPMNPAAVGEFLRCSMGLSAWKQYQTSRWALRVNPSSGNLHPTETYVAWNGRVCHYAPRDHVLEIRADFKRAPVSPAASADGPDDQVLLVALTSIFWREAWKYGERAFRYCQHDVGHAIGSLRFSAALLGWNLRLLPDWSDADIGALAGVDRDADYGDAEREAPECVAIVSADREATIDRDALIAAARQATWHGRPNGLSRSHVEWPAIDAVDVATRKPAGSVPDDHPVR